MKKIINQKTLLCILILIAVSMSVVATTRYYVITEYDAIPPLFPGASKLTAAFLNTSGWIRAEEYITTPGYINSSGGTSSGNINLDDGVGESPKIRFFNQLNNISQMYEQTDGDLYIKAADGFELVGNSFRMTTLTNCDTIDTDASGILSCGTDDAGVINCTVCDNRFVNVDGDAMAGNLSMAHHLIFNSSGYLVNEGTPIDAAGIYTSAGDGLLYVASAEHIAGSGPYGYVTADAEGLKLHSYDGPIVLVQNVIPSADDFWDLGNSSRQWKDVYGINFYDDGVALTSKYVDASGDTMTGNLSMAQHLIFNASGYTVNEGTPNDAAGIYVSGGDGLLYVASEEYQAGSGPYGFITVDAEGLKLYSFNGPIIPVHNLIPSADAFWDLGNSSRRWNDLYTEDLICSDCIALGTETSGNYATSSSEGGDASGLTCSNCVALGSETTGNYAAGDAEAGAALSGDSATDFFSSGTISTDYTAAKCTSATCSDAVDECSDCNGSFVNVGGDTMTGNLSMSYHEISNASAYLVNLGTPNDVAGIYTDEDDGLLFLGTAEYAADGSGAYGFVSADVEGLKLYSFGGPIIPVHNIIPSADDFWDLGNSSRQWKDIYGANFYDDGVLLTSEVDSNASTICSGATTYLSGEGACVDISSVYLGIADQRFNETSFIEAVNTSTNINSLFTDDLTVDADTNASSICSGTTTYLDGEGNCDDISGVYVNEGGDAMTGNLSMAHQRIFNASAYSVNEGSPNNAAALYVSSGDGTLFVGSAEYAAGSGPYGFVSADAEGLKLHSFNGPIVSVHNIIPSAHEFWTLGNSSRKWNDLWVVTSHEGDTVYANDMRITECGTPGIPAMCFLNPDNETVMQIDSDGDLKVRGEIYENFVF